MTSVCPFVCFFKKYDSQTNTLFLLTLIQNSSYSAQAIRQRSKSMRTLLSSWATAASFDSSWGWAVTSDSAVAACSGSKKEKMAFKVFKCFQMLPQM